MIITEGKGPYSQKNWQSQIIMKFSVVYNNKWGYGI